RTLCDDDDAEVSSLGLAPPDLVADLVDVERDFRNEDDVGRAGDPGAESDEPGMATHDLDDHHTLVTLGGRGHFVKSIRGGRDCRIESECLDGPGDVVVVRLSDADHRQAPLAELQRDTQRTVAPDRDERIQPIRPEGIEQLLRAVAFLPHAIGPLMTPFEGIAAVRRAEDGAAEVGDASHLVGSERNRGLAAEQAVESASDADAFPATMDGGENGGADHGVQPGRVPAARRDRESHRSRIKRTTSPASACRFSVFLEKMRRPSTSTSKTPPED